MEYAEQRRSQRQRAPGSDQCFHVPQHDAAKQRFFDHPADNRDRQHGPDLPGAAQTQKFDPAQQPDNTSHEAEQRRSDRDPGGKFRNRARKRQLGIGRTLDPALIGLVTQHHRSSHEHRA